VLTSCSPARPRSFVFRSSSRRTEPSASPNGTEAEREPEVRDEHGDERGNDHERYMNAVPVAQQDQE
jgi:hypothetical protein